MTYLITLAQLPGFHDCKPGNSKTPDCFLLNHFQKLQHPSFQTLAFPLPHIT